MRVIVGDIGGTNSRLALVEASSSTIDFIAEQTYPSQEFSSFDSVISTFQLEFKANADLACFGFPGPVTNRLVKVTNLPWIVDASAIEKSAKIKRVLLLNDLEAAAWEVAALKDTDLFTLQEGEKVLGNAAVISPGTGLGEAGLFWDGSQHLAFACEGGHADFSPNSELEQELLDYLRTGTEHVSWERVLSGPGIHALYKFLGEKRKFKEEDLTLAGDFDPAQLIVERALSGSSERCLETMRLFAGCLGSEAGNLALKIMAKAGVYLGGGIPPRILPFLQSKEFCQAFCSKGRMRSILEKIPLKVITNDKVALLGAAGFAVKTGNSF